MSKNNERRSNKFYLMSYVNKDFAKQVLDSKLGQIKCYAFILHDKDVYLQDVYDDKTHELLHRAGEPEINHLHIYIELYSSRLPAEIVGWFKCLDEDGKLINTLRRYPYNCQTCVDYLTHKWDTLKYQYSTDEIIAYGLKRLDDGSYTVNEEYDVTYDIIDDLMSGVGLKTIIKRYGKDFVYHYSQYKEIVRDILDFKRYGHDFRAGDTQYSCDEDGDLSF